uniref:Uncharacterized protein n=2 Tax=Clastoptera arizonana TaxID=38151 RepID=A0A1B6EE58_9HEMI
MKEFGSLTKSETSTRKTNFSPLVSSPPSLFEIPNTAFPPPSVDSTGFLPVVPKINTQKEEKDKLIITTYSNFVPLVNTMNPNLIPPPTTFIHPEYQFPNYMMPPPTIHPTQIFPQMMNTFDQKMVMQNPIQPNFSFLNQQHFHYPVGIPQFPNAACNLFDALSSAQSVNIMNGSKQTGIEVRNVSQNLQPQMIWTNTKQKETLGESNRIRESTFHSSVGANHSNENPTFPYTEDKKINVDSTFDFKSISCVHNHTNKSNFINIPNSINDSINEITLNTINGKNKSMKKVTTSNIEINDDYDCIIIDEEIDNNVKTEKNNINVQKEMQNVALNEKNKLKISFQLKSKSLKTINEDKINVELNKSKNSPQNKKDDCELLEENFPKINHSNEQVEKNVEYQEITTNGDTEPDNMIYLNENLFKTKEEHNFQSKINDMNEKIKTDCIDNFQIQKKIDLKQLENVSKNSKVSKREIEIYKDKLTVCGIVQTIGNDLVPCNINNKVKHKEIPASFSKNFNENIIESNKIHNTQKGVLSDRLTFEKSSEYCQNTDIIVHSTSLSNSNDKKTKKVQDSNDGLFKKNCKNVNQLCDSLTFETGKTRNKSNIKEKLSLSGKALSNVKVNRTEKKIENILEEKNNSITTQDKKHDEVKNLCEEKTKQNLKQENTRSNFGSKVKNENGLETGRIGTEIREYITYGQSDVNVEVVVSMSKLHSFHHKQADTQSDALFDISNSKCKKADTALSVNNVGLCQTEDNYSLNKIVVVTIRGENLVRNRTIFVSDLKMIEENVFTEVFTETNIESSSILRNLRKPRKRVDPIPFKTVRIMNFNTKSFPVKITKMRKNLTKANQNCFFFSKNYLYNSNVYLNLPFKEKPCPLSKKSTFYRSAYTLALCALQEEEHLNVIRELRLKDCRVMLTKVNKLQHQVLENEVKRVNISKRRIQSHKRKKSGNI